MTRNPATTTREQWFEGLCAPITEEITAFDLRVEGTIPAEFEGRLLRNGPNPVNGLTDDFAHYFLGEGMVHGVRLAGGRAEWYRARWVRGPEVCAALGERPLPGPNADRAFSANTHVIGHAGQTLALTESGVPPVVLDYELGSVCRGDFAGTLPGGFTAHPKRDPATGELHAVCYWWPNQAGYVQYVVIGVDGRVRKVVDVPVPGMPNIHDMALTGRYAVVLDLSVCVDFELAMAGQRFPFAFNPDYGARLGFLPREGEASDVVWVDVEPCYAFHVVNSYDAPDGSVVIDVCRYPRLFERGATGPDNLSTYVRWTVDPQRRTVREEEIDSRPQDFPRVAAELTARPNRFAYSASLDPGWQYGRYTYRHDLTAGSAVVHDHGPGRTGSEPIPVTRPGTGSLEGAEYVFTLVHDAGTGHSELVLLDGADFAAPPVARVHLRTRVPSGFHGDWVPDSSLAL